MSDPEIEGLVGIGGRGATPDKPNGERCGEESLFDGAITCNNVLPCRNHPAEPSTASSPDSECDFAYGSTAKGGGVGGQMITGCGVKRSEHVHIRDHEFSSPDHPAEPSTVIDKHGIPVTTTGTISESDQEWIKKHNEEVLGGEKDR
jgi:hypothetical protein